MRDYVTVREHKRRRRKPKMKTGGGNFPNPATKTRLAPISPRLAPAKPPKPKVPLAPGARWEWDTNTQQWKAVKGFKGPKAQKPKNPIKQGFTDKKSVKDTMNPRALQTFLKSKGFDIAVDGIYGPQTDSARKYWEKNHSARGWKAGAGKPTQTLAGGKSGGGASSAGTLAGRGLQSTKGGKSSPSGGGLGISMPGMEMLPANYGEKMAGLEFDPQINQNLRNQDLLKRQGAQNIADIGNWYGQVLDALATARTRDEASSKAASDSISDMTKGILASLGGAANSGAGMVGNAGDAAAGYTAAMGSAEQQFLADMAPILQSEAAGARTNEQNRQGAALQQLISELADLRGQKGAAKAKYGTDALQYNNQLAQQGFQNQLSAKEAALAAAMTGAQIGSLKAGANGGGFVPWMKLSPPDRDALIQHAMSQIVDDTGALIVSPDKAWNTVRQYLIGQGYTSARGGTRNAASKSMQGLIDAAIRGAIARAQANARAQAGKDS